MLRQLNPTYCVKKWTNILFSISPKGELRWFSRTPEGFLAQCWSLPRAQPGWLVIDVLWGQSHSRPSLAIWIVLSAGLSTGSRSNQECRHALRSKTFCKPAFLKKLAKSHSKEERLGGFPLAVVVKDMSSEKVLQWRQQVGVIWNPWRQHNPGFLFRNVHFLWRSLERWTLQ